jgi:GDPmannose 4,6-dehydratase
MTAVITGVTGQDGSYLSELLLEKGYEVFGIVRRTTSNPKFGNLRGVIGNPRFHMCEADLLDQSSIIKVFERVTESEKIEVYNLAAQSHVATSFACPRSTVEINSIGTLNLLESIKQLGLIPKVRFYQASTSEMFGQVQDVPQTEKTVFWPRSPYGVSKLCAHWLVKNYRESFGLFASCGILFNHESPRRGDMFVTQKIVKGLRAVFSGELERSTTARGQEPLECLLIGNLDAKRDWGHAKDYVRAMWMILQHHEPDEFVASMNEQHSVREFVETVLRITGKTFEWRGSGINEECIVDGRPVVRVSEEFYRPCEVETLLGDSTKMRVALGWKPEFDFEGLVRDMVLN